MHLSRKQYTGMESTGLFRLPTTLHVTYCGLQGVSGREIAPLEVEVGCDECFQSLAWEEIDKASE